MEPCDDVRVKAEEVSHDHGLSAVCIGQYIYSAAQVKSY